MDFFLILNLILAIGLIVFIMALIMMRYTIIEKISEISRFSNIINSEKSDMQILKFKTKLS